jgi:hypothetical protein
MTLLCCSCSSIKTTSSGKSVCKENTLFKKEFVRQIEIIDNFFQILTKPYINLDEFEHAVTEEKVTKFESSLLFISKYTHVSFDSMANYNRSYPYDIYKKDREGWVKWYEENKCNNIQFK